MVENGKAKALYETAVKLEEAYDKSLCICFDNFLCDTCPFYDSHMVNEFGVKCFGNLLYQYTVKLRKSAIILEEKGE